MSLRGKVALVTGSTSGIGLGIARALAAARARRHAERLWRRGADRDAARRRRRGQWASAFAYTPPTCRKPGQIAAMVAETQATLGALDILVNNAGIQFVAKVDEFPAERWDAVIAINLSAVFHGMKAAMPAMKQRGWGRIINIASAHGLVASGRRSPMSRPSMALSA